MIRRFFLAIFLLLPSTYMAQQNADSIVQSIAHLPIAEQLVVLNEICDDLYYGFIPNQEPIYFRRQTLTDSTENLTKRCAAAIDANDYFVRSGLTQVADSMIKPYYTTYFNQLPTYLKGQINNARAIIEETKGDLGKAAEFWQKAINIMEDASSEEDLERYYHYLGRTKGYMGNYAESSVDLNKAKNLALKKNDSIQINEILLSLGVVFSQIGLYEEAEGYIMERRNYQNPPSLEENCLDLVNLGRNDLMRFEFQAAIDKYLEALRLKPEGARVYPFMDFFIFNGLVEGHYFLENEDSVLFYFGEIQRTFEEMQDFAGFHFLYYQSRVLANLVRKNYAQAEEDGLRLYANSIANQDPNEAALHARFLSLLYRGNGEAEKALRYTDIYAHIQDSIQSANKVQTLLLYQTQYETKEKENEIVTLAAENKLTKLRSQQYLYAAIALLVFLLVGSILMYQLQTARKKLKAQNVELSDLNQTKDRFFGIIAHDLRSPLAALSGVDELMAFYLKKNDTAKMAKLGENVGATTRNLSGLLDNLLNWALQQTGKIPHHPQDLNLLELANQTEELFSANADAKGVALQTSIASDHHIFADRDGVQTILRNLVGNAIKFTSSGESVAVSSRSIGEFLEVTVVDDGVGMGKSQLDSLFSLDKRSRKGTAGEAGTGVGLILCKELTELNGGTFRVESEKGVGTKVIFSLPTVANSIIS